MLGFSDLKHYGPPKHILFSLKKYVFSEVILKQARAL